MLMSPNPTRIIHPFKLFLSPLCCYLLIITLHETLRLLVLTLSIQTSEVCSINVSLCSSDAGAFSLHSPVLVDVKNSSALAVDVVASLLIVIPYDFLLCGIFFPFTLGLSFSTKYKKSQK